MAKCANCEAEAFYTYALTTDFGIDYCSRHVPRFLHAQKLAGMLPLRSAEVVNESEVPEETPAPTPKKKSTKKAATTNADNS